MAQDNTKVDLPRDYKIPELFPLEQDKRTRLTIPTRDEGLDPRLNVYSNESYATGSPMDYMDAPAMAGVNFIRRYHTTSLDHLADILQSGLQPKTRGGYQEWLNYNQRMPAVFTESRPPRLDGNAFQRDTYYPHGSRNEVKLEIDIPKDKYRELERIDTNPELDGKEIFRGNRLETIQKGGRTDMFKDELKPEWIKSIYVDEDGKAVKYSLEDFMNKFNCKDYRRDCPELVDKARAVFKDNADMDFYEKFDPANATSEEWDKYFELSDKISKKIKE